ncbi:M23 family metallopeptidase [Ammoniphilus sp. CFH 90114]|uniref:M23 family metallopeptidase n=1 Tax=Ammoniphilus sp. CFH 90114 TaxID=2493665 RepID=UPI00100FCCA3|nr:M23 family metallopeptidase [Ammoniphilus sp. CFH 90114]RXT08873.1 LysM peptidoglycan-binding domain-containing protein [Ammoniphilus sp. CFH 90114]
MERIHKAKNWIQDKWNQGVALVKKNKGKTAIGLVTVSLFITGTGLANHYYNANSKTLYHVLVDGQEIGSVDHPDLVQQFIDKQIASQQSLHGPLNIEVQNQIEYVEETQRNASAANESTIKALQDKIELKVTAQSLTVDGEAVGYTANKELMNQILEEIKDQYGPLPVAQDKAQTVNAAGAANVEVKFKESVSIEESRINPDKIMTKEELMSLLVKGSVEQMIHTVKPGDCISCIAGQYGITSQDIYRNNPGITEDTLLQLGQDIIVTAARPKLTVQTIEEKEVEEVIHYKIEAQTTETMFRGEQKVIQEGKEGRKRVTYQIIRENGVQTEKKIMEEVILAEAVNKIIQKGSKVKPNRGDGKFTWPTHGGRITSGFGPRWGRTHKGLDIAGVSNRGIKASDNGKVVQAGWNGNYGKSVIIDHGNGYKTLYGHLSSVSVSVGDVVQKGDKIGVMGSTGESTGTHLHFEIIKNGSNTNPMRYFRG